MFPEYDLTSNLSTEHTPRTFHTRTTGNEALECSGVEQPAQRRVCFVHHVSLRSVSPLSASRRSQHAAQDCSIALQQSQLGVAKVHRAPIDDPSGRGMVLRPPRRYTGVAARYPLAASSFGYLSGVKDVA